MSNTKPRSNSLSNEVNRTHKSAVRALFYDDFATGNTLEFEGNFKGDKTAVQYKNIVDVKCKETGCNFALNDETRLDFKLQNDSVFRLKLKANNALGHLDLNHHGYSTKVKDQNLDFWFNPYVQYEANRAFANGALYFGLLTHLNNNFYVNNSRVKVHRKGDEVAADFENNWTVKHKNWAFNWYYTDDLKNWGNGVSRKLTAEYLNDKLSFAAELEKKKKGNCWDWNMESLNLGLSYQKNGDLNYGLWSATDLLNDNATTVAAGLHYKVHRDVALKAKADTNQDVTLFANYNWAKGLNLQMSLQSSADSKRCRDVFNNSFKFGLKLKYDS